MWYQPLINCLNKMKMAKVKYSMFLVLITKSNANTSPNEGQASKRNSKQPKKRKPQIT